MPFGFGGLGKNKAAEQEAKARQKAEDERLKKEQEEREIEERNSELLPWDLEQKVATFLNPVKLPFILVAGVLGSIVELKIAFVAEDSYYRGFFGQGPECVVHVADYSKLTVASKENEMLSNVTAMLDELFQPVIDWVNTTAQANFNCTSEENSTKCDILGGPLLNFTTERDFCSVEYDPDRHQCTTHAELAKKLTPAKGSKVGIPNVIPYVPYSLVWMLFKLLFLPVHWVDRVALLAAGYPDPRPEPMFKLLSSPYCDKRGKCGKAAPWFSKLGIASKVIRFSLLPNTLILPLASLRFVKECQNEYIIYTQDASFGFWIYVWLLFDMVSILAMYAVAQTTLNGKAIGTKWYACYNAVAGMMTFIALHLFFLDLFACFNWRFWQGIKILLSIAFTIDLTWDFTLDIAKTVATGVLILDGLQFTVLILSIVAPTLLEKAPIPDFIQELTDRPSDTIMNLARGGKVAVLGGSAAPLVNAEEGARLLGAEEGAGEAAKPPGSPRPPAGASGAKPSGSSRPTGASASGGAAAAPASRGAAGAAAPQAKPKAKSRFPKLPWKR